MAQVGRPRRFDEATLIDAGFAVMSERGFGALSLRRVAAELSVAPNAIYTYVADRQALLRLMLERLLGGIDLAPLNRPDRADDAAGSLEDFCVEMRRELLRQPGGAELVMSAPIDGAAALRLNEALLRTLVGGGLSIVDSARAAYSLQVYVLGTVMLEVADGGNGDPEREELLAAERVHDLARLAESWGAETADVTLTSQTADVVARHNTTEQFRWGVRRLIEGILHGAHEGAQEVAHEGAHEGAHAGAEAAVAGAP